MPNVEEFVIKLNEAVSGPANQAANAIVDLESRIKSQQQAIGQYEDQLASAAQKLRDIGEGDARGAVNVAAFRKQQEVVAGLQQKLDDASASMERLEATRPLAGKAAEFQAARGAITSAARALEELEAKMQLATASGATADVDQLTGAINRQRQAVLSAQQAYVKMGGSAQDAMSAGGGFGTRLGQSAQQGAAGTGELVEALAGVEGEIGGTVSRGQQLSRVLKAMGAAAPALAFVALAVAVVAVTAAIVAATVAATKWAITMADAARNQALAAQSLTANHAALADIATIAPQVQRATGLATDEINKLAEQLAKAKVPAENMKTALEAMATATAGGASTEFLAKLEAGLKETGKVPAELAEQMMKFEAIAKAKMLSLDSQGARLKQNVSGLFKDIKIEPFLKALNEIVKLFDSSTASGKALKFILETMFQPLIDAAAAGIPKVVRGFKLLTIAVLRAFIAVQQLKDALPDTGEGQGGTGGMRVQIDQFNAMAGAASGAHSAVTGVGTAYTTMGNMVDGAIAKLQGTSLASIGANMISSLAGAITGGASSVVGAMTSMIGSAVSAAEQALQIRSPSRVMHRLGRFLPQGMAGGIDDEAHVVEQSSADMAKGAVKGAAKGGSGGGGKSGSRVFEFNNCTFGGDLDESKVDSMMTSWWHRISLEEPEPEGT